MLKTEQQWWGSCLLSLLSLNLGQEPAARPRPMLQSSGPCSCRALTHRWHSAPSLPVVRTCRKGWNSPAVS